MTIAEFLLARIAEDEALARAAGDGGEHWTRPCWHADDPDEETPPLSHDSCCTVEGNDIRIYDEGGHDAVQAEHIARHDPARVLAECAAKRALIKAVEGDPFDAMGAEWVYESLIVEHLSAPYADHPDFDPAWAPS